MFMISVRCTALGPQWANLRAQPPLSPNVAPFGSRNADLTACARSRCKGVGAVPAPWVPHVATDVAAALTSGAREARVARRMWSNRFALSLAFVSLARATGLAIDMVTVAYTPGSLTPAFF